MLIAVVGGAIVLAGAEDVPAAPADGGAAATGPAPSYGVVSPGPAGERSAPGTTDGSVRDAQRATQQSTTRSPERRKRRTRPRIKRAGATPAKVFLGGRPRARFHFRWDGLRARRLQVRVVRIANGKVRRRMRLGRIEPGARERVAWNGRSGGRKGNWLPRGKYAFRVYANGERAKVRKRNSSRQRFRFYRNRFPVRGRHTYGDGFGAGRGHQGQDLFGRCGSKIVAARGGRVQTRAYQSAAGYYVVIDGRGTGRDFVYMHLRRKRRPKVGSWVKTGQAIGRMGATGNASGCHLHFELWTSPGWYQGGHPRSPTRSLRRWDGWS